jgi:chemotaxis protein histidine kinase CheA/FixJ family two-component response regulator
LKKKEISTIPEFILLEELENRVEKKDIEYALLELIREDSDTEKFTDASKKIGIAISEICNNHPVVRQRYFWIAARLVIRTVQMNRVTDLAKAKKIVSSVVHTIRQRSFTSWPNLSDVLVREILYFLFEANITVPDDDSGIQMVFAWFQLDLQLRTISTDWETLPDARDMRLLVESLDNLLTKISDKDYQHRRNELAVLSNRMMHIPWLVESGKLLLETLERDLDKDELLLAIYAVSLRESIANCIHHHNLPAVRDQFFSLLNAIVQCSSSEELHALMVSQSHVATYILVRPDAITALKSTLVTLLTGVEPQLEILFASGDNLAAAKLMNQILLTMRTSLMFLGDTQGVSIINSLIQSLDGQIIHTPEKNESDSYFFAQSWAGLGFYIDHLFSDLQEEHNLPSFLKILPEEIPLETNDEFSADRTLQDIFIIEASERLRILRQQITLFSTGVSKSLPTQIAIEIHALAGSSATVGNQEMHRQAIALEQIINHAISLAPNEQHSFLPELDNGLMALEQQFKTQYDESLSSERFIAGLSIQSSQEDIAAAALELADITPDSQLAISSIDNIPVFCDEFFLSLDTAPEIPDQTDNDTSDQPHDLVDDELRLIFVQEASELLPQLQSLIALWCDMPDDFSFPANLLRLLHTLKGSARMAGEFDLGTSLHELESRVSQLVQKNSIELVEISLLQGDVHTLLVNFGLANSDTPDTHIISDDRTEHETSLVTDQTVKKTLALPVKIRGDILDRAAGSSAELLVNTMRANEQLNEQKQLIADFEDNLARLRTQLRELELQSEVSISAHSSNQASGFDPLEFDRYTRLQELTRMTAESMADLADIQRSLSHNVDASLTLLSAQTRHARAVQSDLRRVGMQAFSSIENRYRQLVRQVAMEIGRDVRFELEGGSVELDRAVLDKLHGPLSHLVRNAIVHGIEPANDREILGKPRQGQIHFKLSDHGNELHLQISDDGRGLDFMRIREHAVATGLLTADAEPDAEILTQLIFEPGFSTADHVTGLAGRGIGMDAVKADIIYLGGALKVTTQSGLGTVVTMAFPKSSSTLQVVQISDGNQHIALPSAMVEQIVTLSPAIAKQTMTESYFEWQGRKIPLCSLSDLIHEPVLSPPASKRISILILHQLDLCLAVKVNEVHGHYEVIVKQPSTQLLGMPGLLGAALLPEGGVLLVMNLLQLHTHAATRPLPKPAVALPVTQTMNPLVMVVDDSLTVRRVSQRMLEKYGYSVVLAKNGAHALEILREITPAAILLDIEMPTMDGFELLSRLRADEHLYSLPVAMITSRMAERHREHAMHLGANAYFGKPYREQEIVDWLSQSLPAGKSPSFQQQFDQDQSLHAAA